MTNEEFFDSIAEYLEPLKDESDMISFCFSYAIKIFPTAADRLLNFQKK